MKITHLYKIIEFVISELENEEKPNAYRQKYKSVLFFSLKIFDTVSPLE